MVDASEYSWAGGAEDPLAGEYCLTHVRGIDEREFLTRLGAEPILDVTDVAGLWDLSDQAWETGDPAYQAVGAFTVDGWCIGVEANGYLGVDSQRIGPVSRGTRLVSHFRNVNHDDAFLVMDDGAVTLRFEPTFAFLRSGSSPDLLLAEMRALGFDLDAEGPPGDASSPTPATHALAEHVTGVRITPAMLNDAHLTCGLVR